MGNLELVINDHLEDMVDAENRCVELTAKQEDMLVVAYIEDYGSLDEWLMGEMTIAEWDQFQADMAKTFAGTMSNDSFFLTYKPFYWKAKRSIIEDIESKIWNSYCDAFNPPPLDYYAEYGLRRSDF